MYKRLLLFVFLIFSATVLSGQSGFSANRPGQVNNPDIVPPGNFMIETGFQYGKNLGSKSYLLPTTFLRYGLNQNFEINFKADNLNLAEKSLFGLTNFNIGSKIKICEQNNLLPKISFVTAYLLPFAGIDSLRPESAGALLQLAASHSLGSKCTLYSNLGAAWNGNDPFPTYNFVVSIYFSPLNRFWTFAELYGLIPEKGTGSIGSDCGFSFQAGENFQIDFTVGADLSDPKRNHYIQLGGAIQLVKKEN